jgi:hypothetical protein
MIFLTNKKLLRMIIKNKINFGQKDGPNLSAILSSGNFVAK